MKIVYLDPAEYEDMRFIRGLRREVDEYLNSPFYVNMIQQEEWFEGVTHDNSKLLFTVRKSSANGVGYAMLTEIDYHHSKCLGQVQISKEFRGRKYGTQAWADLLTIAFSNLGMNKVCLDVHLDNKAAIHVYKRLGFKVEGHLREHYWHEGRFVDVYQMGLLRSEWRNNSDS